MAHERPTERWARSQAREAATPGENIVRRLSFSADFVTARAISHAHDYPIARRAIVINPSSRDAWIDAPVAGPLPPRASTILDHVAVSGDLLVVIDVLAERETVGRRVRDLGWHDYFAPEGRGGEDGDWPKLFRSPQDRIGRVPLDLAALLSQPELADAPVMADVWVNLWYSPPGTDCGIHNQHDFIEVHTQIAGEGRMQKFFEARPETLYEDQLLRPGTTNPTPFCRLAPDGALVYPWHQYRSDTDCLWLAIEYHLTRTPHPD